MMLTRVRRHDAYDHTEGVIEHAVNEHEVLVAWFGDEAPGRREVVLAALLTVTGFAEVEASAPASLDVVALAESVRAAVSG